MLDPEALRVEVDTFMEVYDRKIAEVGLPQGRLSTTCVATGNLFPQCHVAPKGEGQGSLSRLPFPLPSPGPPN